MSQSVNDQQALQFSLQSLYAPIEQGLAEVEEILLRELRSDYPYVNELVQYGCLLGGKRLRPALLLLTAEAVGGVCSEHAILGAVVEMVHTATLIHDDVLDESNTRRHLPTCNSRWNNEASVLLGDYLFTHSFYLASTLDTTYACRTIGRATNIVCEGELRQIGNRGNYSLAEEEYLSIIEAKTAELCACSCRLGAFYACREKETAEKVESIVEQMSEFGRLLGIAFQITDDLLDVLGNESTTGKSLGTDLEKQKPTLPFIRVWSLASAEERKQLLTILQGNITVQREQLFSWFERFDAFEYAREKALEYANRARQVVDQLPDSPAQQTLCQMAEFVVMRSA